MSPRGSGGPVHPGAPLGEVALLFTRDRGRAPTLGGTLRAGEPASAETRGVAVTGCPRCQARIDTSSGSFCPRCGWNLAYPSPPTPPQTHPAQTAPPQLVWRTGPQPPLPTGPVSPPPAATRPRSWSPKVVWGLIAAALAVLCLAGYAIAGNRGGESAADAPAETTSTELTTQDIFYALCGVAQPDPSEMVCPPEAQYSGQLILFPSAGHRDDWLHRQGCGGGPMPVVGPDWAATTSDPDRVIDLVNLGGRRLC